MFMHNFDTGIWMFYQHFTIVVENIHWSLKHVDFSYPIIQFYNNSNVLSTLKIYKYTMISTLLKELLIFSSRN